MKREEITVNMMVIIIIAIAIGLYFLLKNKSGPAAKVNYGPASSHRPSSTYKNNAHKQTTRVYEKSLIEKNKEIIETAISSSKNIKFTYKDKEGEITIRTVKPNRLFMYQLDSNQGEMLCVESFCYLRGASRTFALFRMSNSQIN